MEWRVAAIAFESRILLRRLLRSPGCVVPVILIVAPGSAALACVSAFPSGGLLNAFPYPEPERITCVYGQRASDGVERWRRSGPEFVAARGSGAFAEFAGFGGGSYSLSGDGSTQRVRGLAATANFFRVFGVATLQPAVLLTVVATLALVAVLAGTPAVRRVVRLDPAEALRQE